MRDLFINNLISKIKIISNFEKNKVLEDYRIGDVVFRKGWSPAYDEWKKICKKIVSNKDLKYTFLYIYLTKYQSPEYNNNLINYKKKLSKIIYKIFDDLRVNYSNKIPGNTELVIQRGGENIIRKSSTFKTPGDEELVIQIRLGDVIVHNWYLKKNYVKLIRDLLSTNKIKKITIVCAFFFANVTTNQNKKYFFYTKDSLRSNINNIYNILKNIHTTFPKIKLNIYSNYNPDVDFYYLIKAKHLITDEGGFGSLAQIVRDNQ